MSASPVFMLRAQNISRVMHAEDSLSKGPVQRSYVTLMPPANNYYIPPQEIPALLKSKLGDAENYEKLNSVSYKKGFRLRLPLLENNFKQTPGIVSPAILQAASRFELDAPVAVTQVYFSKMNYGFNRSLGDFSARMDIASKYTAFVNGLTSQYKNVLNSVVEKELANLRQLRNTIEQRLNGNVDSLMVYLKGGELQANGISSAELNAETLSSPAGAAICAKLDKLKANTGTGAGQDTEKITAIINDIRSLSNTAAALKIDSLIGKYDELSHAETGKLLNSPGKVRRFIKEHKLKYDFSLLMLLKQVDIGNFFEPAGPRQSASRLSAGNIQQGLGLVLNTKSKIKTFLGSTITDRFDALWHPDGLQQYREMNRKGALADRLNGTIAVSNIKALGGIDASFNQSSSRANAVHSFFGLDRVFRSFNITKELLRGNTNISIDAATNLTSYSQRGAGIKYRPKLPTQSGSFDLALMYTGTYTDQGILVSGMMRGSFGSNPVNTTGVYERPSLYGDVHFSKKIKDQAVLRTQLDIRRYSLGIKGEYFSSRNIGTGADYFINRKHTVGINLLEQFSGYTGMEPANLSNHLYSVAGTHSANFKKKGLRYNIWSKASITRLNSSMLHSGTARAGWIREIQNSFSIAFPNKVALQHSFTLSFNSFSHDLYLNGNRMTIEPGVSVGCRRVQYYTGVVYETVGGYYRQAGLRASVSVPSLFKKISVTANADTRYTIDEQVKVFGSRVVSFGNLGVQYQLNK